MTKCTKRRKACKEQAAHAHSRTAKSAIACTAEHGILHIPHNYDHSPNTLEKVPKYHTRQHEHYCCSALPMNMSPGDHISQENHYPADNNGRASHRSLRADQLHAYRSKHPRHDRQAKLVQRPNDMRPQHYHVTPCTTLHRDR